MILVNGQIEVLAAADYAYNANMTVGTALIEFSIENEPFTEIEGANYSSSANGVMSLPNCRLRATITGDAIVALKAQQNTR